MTPLPVFVLDLHNICNQQCPYCIAQNKEFISFEALREPESLEAVRRFFAALPPMNVLLTGGEPLITPGLIDFLRFLVDLGHQVSMQSNLKADPSPFTNAVPAARAGWIMATLHSVAHDNRHQFARTVSTLRDQGYPVVAKLVLDDPTLKRLEELYDLLKEAGAGVLLSPLVLLNPDEDGIPVRRYCAADWRRITPRIHLLSAWLYFAGGFRSQGRSCLAGSHAFYGRLANGVVSGCAHSIPEHIGSIPGLRFQPETRPLACPLPRCTCDFNYYVGMIQGLDDSEGIARLAAGDNAAIPLADYSAWLEKAGAEPLIRLWEDMGLGPT